MAQSISKNHYVQRAKILTAIPIFDGIAVYSRTIKWLDAECNAAHLAQYLLEKVPSYVPRGVCLWIHKHKQIQFLEREHRHHFVRSCRKILLQLQQKSAMFEQIWSHLVIDTTVFSDLGYPSRENIVMARLNSITALKTKHYVAYGLTGEYWHKNDGLLKKRSALNPNTTIKPHLIIYAICGS
ncbi:Uncharacterized protein OBRU01_22373 [Operophtera brumata]|uniref:Uncharacterized protein n=1 Tax=Operophtera brumata TaxID=104452 RepID=A0A0L7KRI0_OPEBR|nr:Uncharacterized protein OBRU01_22373 [Operophtera brumata]